ncbi:MAG: peptidylprolyl isomerase [Candidatus Nitrospinota bacterium M3_3B_026]
MRKCLSIPAAFLAAVLLAAAPSAAATPLAKVGDRVITLEEIKKVVASMPLGGGVNDLELIAEALEGAIDSELLYIEAKESGLTESEKFRREAAEFREATLADAYRKKMYETKAEVSEKEITEFAKREGATRRLAESILKSRKREAAAQKEAARLFEAHNVAFSPIVAEKSVDSLEDGDLLASADSFRIFYKDVRGAMANYGGGKEGLLDLLAQMVEVKLFAAAAEEAGLAEDAEFRAVTAEYEKSLAVNMRRERLHEKNAPTEKEIERYIEENPYLRSQPRFASALMIVTRTKEEALRLRERAMAGENFHELAMEHSIVPSAKATAGRIPPIRIGGGPYSVIDRSLLSLKPGEVTEPIEGTKGYSIFKLIEITDAKPRDEIEMRKLAGAALLEVRLEEHLAKLRSSGRVEIYEAGAASVQ